MSEKTYVQDSTLPPLYGSAILLLKRPAARLLILRIWETKNKNSFIGQSHHGSISPTCLHTAFTSTDPKSAKRQWSHQYLFAFLGSSRAKAGCRMLVKLTPSKEVSAHVIGTCLLRKNMCRTQKEENKGNLNPISYSQSFKIDISLKN